MSGLAGWTGLWRDGGFFVGARSVSERLEVGLEEGGAGFEVGERDVLVLGVGLGDGAGADGDGGGAGGGEEDGVAEPGGACEFRAGGEEGLDEGMRGVGVERVNGRGVVHGGGGVDAVDELLEQLMSPAVTLKVGGDADVEAEGAAVGDDVVTGAAVDEADVEGGGSQVLAGAGELGEEIAEVGVEGGDESGHFGDGVFTEFGTGAVGGAAMGVDVDPQAAFVSVNDLHFGGLADEGEVIARMVSGEVFGAVLVGFLGHEADEVDLDGEGGDLVTKFPERPEHGGHGALGVGGAAAPEFTVVDVAIEGGDGHAGDGDGVGVGGKEEAGFGLTSGRWQAGEAADDIGAAGEDFIEEDLGARLFQEGGDEGGDAGFADIIGRSAGVAVGIDGGDADEGLGKLDDAGGERRHGQQVGSSSVFRAGWGASSERGSVSGVWGTGGGRARVLFWN